MTAEERHILRENDERKHTFTNYIDASGRRRCDGAADLKSTQAYPMGFGCAHASEYHAHSSASSSVQSRGNHLEADADSDSEIGDTESAFDDFAHGEGYWDYAPTASDASASSSDTV